MALFEMTGARLSTVKQVSLAAAGIKEREHIQQALVENIDAVLDGVLVICDEQNLWVDANRRVDLLCLDQSANVIIVELKRDNTGSYADLQAIRYAAMLSTLTFAELCDVHARYRRSKGESIDSDQAESIIRSFLGWSDEGEKDDFNNDPRIVLVSGNFSKELTNTVLWLNSKGLDISCIRIVAYTTGDQTLLDVQRIIPVPEAEDYQVKVRRRQEEKAGARRYNRDYTRYSWRGQTYWKNQLAHAIILDWVEKNSPQSVEDIQAAFPVPNAPYMLATLEHADRMEIRDGRARHYKADDEVLRTGDGQVYCVSRGWDINTITALINIARSLGYEVTEATDGNNSP